VTLSSLHLLLLLDILWHLLGLEIILKNYLSPQIIYLSTCFQSLLTIDHVFVYDGHYGWRRCNLY